MAKYMRVYANTLTEQESGKFLDEDRLRRVLECDYEGALRALKDYGWGDGMADEATAESLPTFELNKLINFIEENAVDENIKKVLLAPYLFHNAKVAYKEKVTGKSSDGAKYNLGDEVIKSISEGNYRELPQEMQECLNKMDDDSATAPISPKKIDIALTEAQYAYMLRCGKHNKHIYEYVRAEIDLKNLLLLKRARLLGSTGREITEMYIGGGKLDKDEWLSALESSEDGTEKYYAMSGYGDVFNDKGIVETEMAIDTYLYSLTEVKRINYMRDDLFVRYFRRAEAEIKAAHMILVCLKNKAAEEIRRRLRPIYE